MDDFHRLLICHIINIISRFLFTCVAAMLVCEGHIIEGTIVFVVGWLGPTLEKVKEDE